MAVNATWIQAGGDTAAQDRALQTALLAKGGLATARPGVLPSTLGDLAVTAQGSPNMTVNVAAGQCVIEDSTGLAYVLTNDATVVVTISAASGSNPRFDLIIARIYDNAAGDSVSTTTLALAGSGGNATVQTKTAAIEVVTGTPAGSPVAPALPNTRSVILAVITVGTSVTSINSGNIASSGGGAAAVGYTAAAGGLVVCRTSAEYPASPYEGQEVYDETLNYKLLWDGSKWEPQNTTAAWVAYTPTLTNMTIGNGSVLGRYCQIGKSLLIRWVISFGTTTTVSGQVSLSLPAGFTTINDWEQTIPLDIFVATVTYPGIARIPANTTAFNAIMIPTAANNVALVAYSSLLSFVSGNFIVGQGTLDVQ